MKKGPYKMKGHTLPGIKQAPTKFGIATAAASTLPHKFATTIGYGGSKGATNASKWGGQSQAIQAASSLWGGKATKSPGSVSRGSRRSRGLNWLRNRMTNI